MLYVEFNKKKLLEADASSADVSAAIRGQDAETSTCPSLSTTFRGMVLTDRLVGFCLHLLGSNFVPTQTCKSFSFYWTIAFHSMQESLKLTAPRKLPAMDYSLSYFDHLKRTWLIRSVPEHNMEDPQVSWVVKIRSK